MKKEKSNLLNEFIEEYEKEYINANPKENRFYVGAQDRKTEGRETFRLLKNTYKNLEKKIKKAKKINPDIEFYDVKDEYHNYLTFDARAIVCINSGLYRSAEALLKHTKVVEDEYKMYKRSLNPDDDLFYNRHLIFEVKLMIVRFVKNKKKRNKLLKVYEAKMDEIEYDFLSKNKEIPTNVFKRGRDLRTKFFYDEKKSYIPKRAKKEIEKKISNR